MVGVISGLQRVVCLKATGLSLRSINTVPDDLSGSGPMGPRAQGLPGAAAGQPLGCMGPDPVPWAGYIILQCRMIWGTLQDHHPALV